MAPRKPAPQAAKATVKKSKVTVWPAEAPHAHDHTHHHHGHGACCGHDHSHKPSCGAMLACLCACCPIAKVIFTRSFWAASVVAFLVIFATDWLLHTRFLLQDYHETAALWRADGEIRHSLIFVTQALTAMVYAAIILSLGHAGRWFGSFTSGLLAGCLPAIGAMTSYVMLPFATPYIPAVWAIASLLQGGLVGFAVCAALKASRAPETGDCCTPKPTLH